MDKICDINSRSGVADFLDIPYKQLTYILYIKKVDSLYISFEIPKKYGGFRQINAPKDNLKSLQKKLADSLWMYQDSLWREKNIKSSLSHAFEKGKSIFTNARIHKNKRFVMNVDLEGFFESFHFGRIRGFFEKNRDYKLPIEVATVLAQLTCYNGHLPQGAPSSPIITNIICQILDVRLLEIAKKYRLDYTRYADDLTFSTNEKSFMKKQEFFYEEMQVEIENAGFRINHNKTRLQHYYSKQKVTGLVVNEKINIDNIYYRKTRAMAHNLYKTGIFKIDGSPGTIEQLEGRFSFINQIDRYNHSFYDKKYNFYNLTGRDKQYQKLLFYKNFYSNSKPLIITEGKTDAKYIEAALKNLHADYPTLISKKRNGAFEFKVSFLKRTTRLKHFMNLDQYGADTIKGIYRFYSQKDDNGKYPNYLAMFNNITESRPRYPVYLLFDNELKNKDKPLREFVSYVRLTESQRSDFESNLNIKLIEDSNLHLVTNQLMGGADESEIEDLFDSVTLSQKVGGKTFSRNKNYDINKHYGKEIFSDFIARNYSRIDFTEFRCLLDSITKILETY